MTCKHVLRPGTTRCMHCDETLVEGRYTLPGPYAGTTMKWALRLFWGGMAFIVVFGLVIIAEVIT
ncbi:MAG: hypothetical protein RB191_19930 [Terriglobia bacterium]|nr:hypothetical protein [Terriglobia bacterium]